MFDKTKAKMEEWKVKRANKVIELTKKAINKEAINYINYQQKQQKKNTTKEV